MDRNLVRPLFLGPSLVPKKAVANGQLLAMQVTRSRWDGFVLKYGNPNNETPKPRKSKIDHDKPAENPTNFGVSRVYRLVGP